MANVVRPRVFLDVQIGTEPGGRLVIELFVDKAPKTCENFRTLCIGSQPPLTYKRSPFHRVIDEFMVQGGDITKGDGTGGDSIYGGEFEDENIGWRQIDKEGLVCMANRGKGTNTSQFFITLAPCEHLNAKHTVFGQLVSGKETLDRMTKVAVDKNDRPLEDVLIAHCGELERRKRPTTTTTEAPTKMTTKPSQPAPALDDSGSDSRRGRKRRRGSISSSRSVSSQARSARHSNSYHHQGRDRRRRSDKSPDSVLRGRGPLRSSSPLRSPSPRKPILQTQPTPSPPHRHHHHHHSSHKRRRHHHRDRSPSSPAHSLSRSRSPLPHDERRRRSRSTHNRSSRRHSHDFTASSFSLRRHGYDYERPRHNERADEELILQEEWAREGGDERYEGVDADGHGEDYTEDVGREGYRRPYRERDRSGWDRERNNGREGYGNGSGNGAGDRDGRLGGAGAGADDGAETNEDGAVKFKGRGSMKYRERERQREYPFREGDYRGGAGGRSWRRGGGGRRW